MTVRRWFIAAVAAAVTGGLLGAIPAGTAGAATDTYFGYGTGTLVHADALQLGDTGPRVANVEEGFSTAAVGSNGFDGAVLDELAQPVKPQAAKATDKSYGSGLSVGAGVATNVPNDPNGDLVDLPDFVSAEAPPSSGLQVANVLSLPANPLLYANVLPSAAQANWNDNTCILGQPISYGSGAAADVQVLSTGAANNPNGTLVDPLLALDAPNGPDPTEAVAQSTSFTYLKPNADGTFGLVSEVHETIAPVTIAGTTIEFLGTWVLRATATGVGKGQVFYGPGTVNKDTPILRVVNPDKSVNEILKFQDLFGSAGLPVPLINIPGVAEITIGEDPRAIGGEAGSAVTENNTSAAGAVDVVRVKLLASEGIHAADIRIGHMETEAVVPAGGIHCPIPVKKSVDKQSVNAGDDFSWTITVPSDKHSFDGLACDLVNLVVTDTIEVDTGTPAWTITSVDHDGHIDNNNHVTWNGTPGHPLTYHPGADPLVFTIHGHATGGPGVIKDTANATANLANCTGGASGNQLVGQAVANVKLSGLVTIIGPGVNAVLAAQAAKLPRTGGALPIAAAMLLLLGAFAVHSARKRVTS